MFKVGDSRGFPALKENAMPGDLLAVAPTLVVTACRVVVVRCNSNTTASSCG